MGLKWLMEEALVFRYIQLLHTTTCMCMPSRPSSSIQHPSPCTSPSNPTQPSKPSKPYPTQSNPIIRHPKSKANPLPPSPITLPYHAFSTLFPLLTPSASTPPSSHSDYNTSTSTPPPTVRDPSPLAQKTPVLIVQSHIQLR